MNISYTRTITTGGCGMPMMPMTPMPMGGCGAPMMGPSLFCRPNPMMVAGGAVMAGACIGAALATPGVMNAIGSGLKWGYNNLVLPVWNGVIKPAALWTYNNILKPVGLWTYNNILKPIGSGLKWVWDHTLGWVFKKIETATNNKKSKVEKSHETKDVKKSKKAEKSEKIESSKKTAKSEGTSTQDNEQTIEIEE